MRIIVPRGRQRSRNRTNTNGTETTVQKLGLLVKFFPLQMRTKRIKYWQNTNVLAMF